MLGGLWRVVEVTTFVPSVARLQKTLRFLKIIKCNLSSRADINNVLTVLCLRLFVLGGRHRERLTLNDI